MCLPFVRNEGRIKEMKENRSRIFKLYTFNIFNIECNEHAEGTCRNYID